MKNATDIVVVLDKSGSMMSTKEDVIGGFNSFLKEQKALSGDCTLTMVLFDNNIDFKPACLIRDVQMLDGKTYVPGGMTSLLDALGRAVNETGRRLAELEEAQRPDKVIVIVITDGQENSSREHTLQTVRNMIEHQQNKYSWKFMFLGANVDSFTDAAKLGISRDTTLNYTANAVGTQCLYRGISSAISNYREVGEIGEDWKTIISTTDGKEKSNNSPDIDWKGNITTTDKK